jgi:hypothetical protein
MLAKKMMLRGADAALTALTPTSVIVAGAVTVVTDVVTGVRARRRRCRRPGLWRWGFSVLLWLWRDPPERRVPV